MNLNFGIIGTGSIADGAHAPALKSLADSTLHSVYSESDKRGKDFKIKHGAMISYTNMHDFLNDGDLDAVIIASPDNLHATQIIQCAEAGKHILVEKPMAVTEQECIVIKNACEKNNVKLAVGFNLRWHSGHQLLHDKICNAQAIGEFRHMRLHYTFQQKDASNWRATKELGTWWSLAATGAHCFDLAFWFAGKNRRVVERSSLINNKIWNGAHDDSATACLLFDDGLTVEIHSSVLYASTSRFEIYGTNGSAICDDTLNRKGSGSIFINDRKMAYSPVNTYEAQIKNFINTIQNPDISNPVDYNTGAIVTRELLLSAS